MRNISWIVLCVVLMLTFMLSSCEALKRKVKDKAGTAADDAGNKGLKNSGAKDAHLKIPLLDDNGNPVFDENKQPVMVYKTSMIQDFVNLILGGAKLESIFTYIMSVLLLLLGRYLGVTKTTKKFGSIIDVKDDAMELVTRKINKMASSSTKFGDAFEWLTDAIQKSASKHTDVGAVIHTAAKSSEHKRAA